MKNRLSLLATFFLFSGYQLFAQAPLKEGANQFNVGVGLSGWGIPIYVGLDHGFKKDITLGGELSFRSYGNDYNKVRYNHRIIGISANGNYHFNTILEIPKEWDFYAGLNLGFYFWSSDSDYKGDGSSGVGLGLQIGGRYFFDKRWGLNVEFGGATVASGGKFGITYLL